MTWIEDAYTDSAGDKRDAYWFSAGGYTGWMIDSPGGTDYAAPHGWAPAAKATAPAPSYVAPPPPPDTPSIRLEEPAYLATVRGSHIPIGRGNRRVGGRPIDRVRNANPNADGSLGGLVAYSFGSRLAPEVTPALIELIANGLTIWDAESGAIEGVTVRYYDASPLQQPDPALVAAHGADKTPAYLDHIYAVVEFDSFFPFGNAEPKVVARLNDNEWAYGEAIDVDDIIRDMCARAGLNVALGSLPGAPPGAEVMGFSEDEHVHGIHIAGEVHPLDFLKNAGRLWQFDVYETLGRVRVQKITIPAPTPTVADIPLNHRLAVNTDGSTVTTKAASRHVAKIVEVSYQDTSIDEQASVQRARNEASDSADVERWDVPFVMTASRALTQASLALQQAEAESDEHRHVLPPQYLKLEPCDTVAFSVEGKAYAAKVWSVTINSDFSVEVEYRNLTESRAAWTQQTELIDPVDPVDPSTLILQPTTGDIIVTGNAPNMVPSAPAVQPSTGALTLTGNVPNVPTPSRDFAVAGTSGTTAVSTDARQFPAGDGTYING